MIFIIIYIHRKVFFLVFFDFCFHHIGEQAFSLFHHHHFLFPLYYSKRSTTTHRRVEEEEEERRSFSFRQCSRRQSLSRKYVYISFFLLHPIQYTRYNNHFFSLSFRSSIFSFSFCFLLFIIYHTHIHIMYPWY